MSKFSWALAVLGCAVFAVVLAAPLQDRVTGAASWVARPSPAAPEAPSPLILPGSTAGWDTMDPATAFPEAVALVDEPPVAAAQPEPAEPPEPPRAAPVARPAPALPAPTRALPPPPAPAVPPSGATVLASWYGPGFYGNRTACGQVYSPAILGVAHRTLPCGTLLQLQYGGVTVTVPVIDRGPFIAGRTLDLSNATRAALGCSDLCTVRMQMLN
jgi:rare lipoprotein A